MRRNDWNVLALLPVLWASSALPAAAQAPNRDEGAGPAPRAAAPVRPSIDPDGKRLEHLLDLWAQRSTILKSLDVRIARVDRGGAAWGDQVFQGRALFKTPNRAWIDFRKVVEDEKKQKTTVPFERIVCTGQDVWQYRSDTKQIYIHKLGEKERERALLQGPLPFLFNFRADDAKDRYRMKLVSEDKTSYVIGVAPLLKVDREYFSQALIKLDRSYLLPTRIVLIAMDNKTTRDYVLSDIKPNATVMDENFKGQKLPKPWTITVNEDSNAPAPPDARPGPQPVVGKGSRRRTANVR